MKYLNKWSAQGAKKNIKILTAFAEKCGEKWPPPDIILPEQWLPPMSFHQNNEPPLAAPAPPPYKYGPLPNIHSISDVQ